MSDWSAIGVRADRELGRGYALVGAMYEEKLGTRSFHHGDFAAVGPRRALLTSRGGAVSRGGFRFCTRGSRNRSSATIDSEDSAGGTLVFQVGGKNA